MEDSPGPRYLVLLGCLYRLAQLSRDAADPGSLPCASLLIAESRKFTNDHAISRAAKSGHLVLGGLALVSPT